jgi:hypothetical protein
MQDEEKTIDVGDAEEQEQEIDLDAQPAKETKEEEKIEVEKVEAEEPAPVEDPKEELSDYSEGVNKRIAKLTRKMREAERQKEEAINYAKTVKENAAKIQNRYNNLDESYAKEFEKRVTTNLDATKQKLAQAIHAGDIDKQVEAQSELSQLSMEASRLARVKELQENKPVDKATTPETTPQQPRPQQVQPADPKAEAWAAKNPWFGTDNAMTYTAFDIHKNLVEQEGFDPFSDDYYAEVDKRIRLDFPHKFGKVQESAVEQEGTPVQNVASAKRPAAKGRRKTVRLTPSQVAISKRLGVPLEEYAKQLAAKEV